MEVALSRAVSWPQICDKLILKKVQVAGEAQQLRMSTYPRAGWRGLIGNADMLHMCLITHHGAGIILAQTWHMQWVNNIYVYHNQAEKSKWTVQTTETEGVHWYGRMDDMRHCTAVEVWVFTGVKLQLWFTCQWIECIILNVLQPQFYFFFQNSLAASLPIPVSMWRTLVHKYHSQWFFPLSNVC